MVRQCDFTEVEIDGRSFWARPVSPNVLHGNVVAAALAESLGGGVLLRRPGTQHGALEYNFGHIRVRRLGEDLRRLSLMVPMVTLLLVMAACGGFSKADLAFNDGVDASDHGLYTEAISHYDKAIQLDPSYVGAYNNRGSAYSRLGQHQRAIEDLDKAIQLDPNYALAYTNRGRALSALGKHDLANKNFNKACELDRSHC